MELHGPYVKVQFDSIIVWLYFVLIAYQTITVKNLTLLRYIYDALHFGLFEVEVENTKMKQKPQTGMEWNQKMFTSLSRALVLK